jgi:hypothetical protein
LTQISISKKFEKEIVFGSSVLAWIRIRIEQKCWIRIRIKSIRIHNPEKKEIKCDLLDTVVGVKPLLESLGKLIRELGPGLVPNL